MDPFEPDYEIGSMQAAGGQEARSVTGEVDAQALSVNQGLSERWQGSHVERSARRDRDAKIRGCPRENRSRQRAAEAVTRTDERDVEFSCAWHRGRIMGIWPRLAAFDCRPYRCVLGVMRIRPRHT